MVVLFTESGKKGVGRTIGKNGFSLVNLTLRDLWDVPIGHWIHTSAVRYTDLRIDQERNEFWTHEVSSYRLGPDIQLDVVSL